MKISKFVEHNNTSNDTIRHYMKLGLINPIKNGGQYDFDDNCQKSFDHIQQLKDMKFSLSEIKTLLFYEKIGRLTQYNKISEYRSLYEDKLSHINQEIAELTQAKTNLEDYLTTLKTPEPYNHSFGIPLNNIDLFHCPLCQKNLSISDGTIEDNSLVSGQLTCECGETYTLVNGILINTHAPDKNDIISATEFIGTYIKDTSDAYLNNISRALEFFNGSMDSIDLEGKVLVEAGTGWGVFIRYIYDLLSDSATYIAVEKSYEQLLLLKETLAQVPIKKNVIFICADFESLPLKHESVDFLIDATGSASYNFLTDKWLLDTFKPYLKPRYGLLAGYILFSKFNLDSEIPVHLRKYYDNTHLDNHLQASNIKVLASTVFDQVHEGGPYDSYFADGELVYMRCLHGIHQE